MIGQFNWKYEQLAYQPPLVCEKNDQNGLKRPKALKAHILLFLDHNLPGSCAGMYAMIWAIYII